ncbi:MAG: methyltransferase domain-containing protein [Desulfovibrio sp.]|jgi:SAM-dependent methyltransferase|nr:methyltransferase domain-containing protein [Desulfovibrio sp.]
MNTLWQRKDILQAGGGALRPGGMELTRRGLALCAGCCGLESSALVLDLGCGAGAALSLLLAEGYQAFGVDENIQPALTDRPGCRGRTIRADIARLPLADAKADALLCECVLSLLPDPAAALKEWHRVLRPGGALIMSDFYLREPESLPPLDARRDASCPGVSRLNGRGMGGARLSDPRPDGLLSPGLSQSGCCLDGALFAREWEELLRGAGFLLRAREDHSAGLAALAARLVWYGRGDLPEIFGLCSPGKNRPRGARRYGYGLWTAQKEAA